MTNKNVSENLVYKVAKVMYGNLDYMKKLNPNFKRVNTKSATQDLGAKRHRGLTKYLKEVGAL